MDTNALVRGLVARLVDAGLSQVAIAQRMGLSPTWFSRWLNEKDDRVLPVTAVDGLVSFIHDQRLLLEDTAYQVEQSLTKRRDAAPPARTARGGRK